MLCEPSRHPGAERPGAQRQPAIVSYGLTACFFASLSLWEHLPSSTGQPPGPAPFMKNPCRSWPPWSSIASLALGGERCCAPGVGDNPGGHDIHLAYTPLSFPGIVGPWWGARPARNQARHPGPRALCPVLAMKAASASQPDPFPALVHSDNNAAA